MGQYPSDEELLQMIAEVDDDGSNEIEFSEFLKVIENQKKRDARADDDSDTVLAYVALGGCLCGHWLPSAGCRRPAGQDGLHRGQKA